MTTAPICYIDCSDYLWEAKKYDARADESFTYLEEMIREDLDCQAVRERKFAQSLRDKANERWDHLAKFHPEDLKSLNEY